ncbi:hypothetical protein P8452_08224 [Trifolium repens]|nr:hypothetical protein P8452_08224 [Trifolium repens]
MPFPCWLIQFPFSGCSEVKFGETLKVDPNEFEACIHLSQAALGESKKDKGNDSVVLFVKVGEQKLVLGTLLKDKIPQISLELVLDKEFELSHNSKTASVHLSCTSEDDYIDSDEEEIPLAVAENADSQSEAQSRKNSQRSKQSRTHDYRFSCHLKPSIPVSLAVSVRIN